MTNRRQALGLLGERIAARWLQAHDWRVREHRFRNGRRDIDLVAERAGTIAFVEVKARRGDAFGDPVEAVHWRKQRELVRSAQVWIDRHPGEGERFRFDVIGVLVSGPRVRVRHVEDAFALGGRGTGGEPAVDRVPSRTPDSSWGSARDAATDSAPAGLPPPNGLPMEREFA